MKDETTIPSQSLSALTTSVTQLTQPWGRKTEATWLTSFLSLTLVLICPVCLFLNCVALKDFNSTFIPTLQTLYQLGPIQFFNTHGPHFTTRAAVGYTAWLLFQGALYTLLPGPLCTGQRTPAGNLLKYRTNGLLAWTITHALFLSLGALGWVDLAIIANNWDGLLVAATIYGILLSAFCVLKAHIAPSHPSDRKFSGSLIFDFFVGIELNPRFGELWDFKFFHNGRPGIIAWTMISISFTAKQYQELGRVSGSMWVVDVLYMLYVVDFFVNEDWYLRTIDMAHDHFGYYLGRSPLLSPFFNISLAAILPFSAKSLSVIIPPPKHHLTKDCIQASAP